MAAAVWLARVRLFVGLSGGECGCVLAASERAEGGWWVDSDPDPALGADWRGRKAVGVAIVGSSSVGGGTVGIGSALPPAAGAFVTATATATAPAPEEAEPASDSAVGSVEQREGEVELRRSADSAADCGEEVNGACCVLERLGAKGVDWSRGKGAIFAAMCVDCESYAVSGTVRACSITS